jgi:hypothetical protein
MLDPFALERRFVGDLPAPANDAATAPRPARARRKPAVTQFQLAVAGILAVVALAVVIATVRMTDRAVYQAVESREAPARFLADQLGALRLLAMTSPSPVAARLYLGIDECFKARVAVPFDDEHLPLARQTVDTCADMEIGRLYAQGGAALAEQGRRILEQASVPTPYSAREAEQPTP